RRNCILSVTPQSMYHVASLNSADMVFLFFRCKFYDFMKSFSISQTWEVLLYDKESVSQGY
ncbi:hypothetical protein LCGC14_2416950, partial [marine sediment metagenome]